MGRGQILYRERPLVKHHAESTVLEVHSVLLVVVDVADFYNVLREDHDAVLEVNEALLLALDLAWDQLCVCCVQKVGKVYLGISFVARDCLVELPLKGPISVSLEDCIRLVHLHLQSCHARLHANIIFNEDAATWELGIHKSCIE